MKSNWPMLLCTLCLALPAAAARAASEAPRTTADLAALRVVADPSLESLRAGRALAPAAFGRDTFAALQAADASAADLLDLRAGYVEMSDNDWKYVAIGGLVVLALIVIF